MKIGETGRSILALRLRRRLNADIGDLNHVEKTADGASFNLLAVIDDKLYPLRRTEPNRSLQDLGMQAAHTYRIEVCLPRSKLKQVLT